MADTALKVSAAANIMICSDPDEARPLVEAIQAQGHRAVCHKIPHLLSKDVRCLLAGSDIVLVDVTSASSEILKTIERLHVANAAFNLGPRLLCFSTAHRNPHFVMAVKKWGAQYVRVDGMGMLCEAINLLYNEVKELERKGPCFEIIHRFSQGSCAPGEEVTSISLLGSDEPFQLQLGLTLRVLFDFFGQHREVALDAQQIISGVSGDWFYRDHAKNSGHRQVTKIRRPAVKVNVERLRDAMAYAFARCHMRIDPYHVLRSYPVVGSKRVLYRLIADVRWRHSR